MAEFTIQRAERKQARARVALTGVSNSGKTMSALLMAKGLVQYMLENGEAHGNLHGKVGLIDTERRSASLYAHLFPFDVIELGPPYTPQRYIDALRTFEHADYAVVIIDSASHAWMGKGGILSQVDEIASASKSGNSFSPWKDVAGDEAEFWESLLASPCHLFCTMRAKSAWVLSQKIDRSGQSKTVPQKVGMKPIQREGFEYEFTIGLQLELETNRATAFKDRTELFGGGRSMLLDEEWGQRLGHWLYSGAESTMLAPEAKPLDRMFAAAGALERAMDRAKNLPDLAREFETGIARVKAMKSQLTTEEGEQLVKQVNHLIRVKDLRKAALSPAAGPVTEDPVDVAVAVDLEEQAWSVHGGPDPFLKHFGLQRFAQLPAARLDEARAWLESEKAAPPADAMDAVADMKDDLPWDDDVPRETHEEEV